MKKTVQEIKVTRCEECPFLLEDSLSDDYGCYVGGAVDSRKIHWDTDGAKVFDELIPEYCPLKANTIEVKLKTTI